LKAQNLPELLHFLACIRVRLKKAEVLRDAPSDLALINILVVIQNEVFGILEVLSDWLLREYMLAGLQRCSDVFGLILDRKGYDNGVNVRSEKQVMVCLPRAGIVRVEIDMASRFTQCLGRFERP
jgi:hypothetical protein